MKRKLLVLALAALLLLNCTLMASAHTFRDIDDSATEEAVELLYTLGIVNGFDDYHYQPDSLLTRAQFCKLLVLALNRGQEVSQYSNLTRFSDVTSSHWAIGYVNMASDAGYINGYGNGKFGPEDTLTYGQAVTILLRALGYTTEQIGYFWPADYVSFAESIGLDGGLGLDAYSPVDRGEAAILLVAFLYADKVNGNGASGMGGDGAGNTYLDGLTGDTLDEAILLDTDATSDDGDRHCALFYMDGRTVYYEQEEELDADLVGCIGTICLNDDGAVTTFLGEDEGYSVRYGVYLGDEYDGKLLFYTGRLRSYRTTGSFASAQNHGQGYLLLNENNYAEAFVMDPGPESAEITMREAEADTLYYTASRYYEVEDGAPVFYQDAEGEWQIAAWYDIFDSLAAGKVTVYFDYGRVSMVLFAALEVEDPVEEEPSQEEEPPTAEDPLAE